jgi:hypothetical protein
VQRLIRAGLPVLSPYAVTAAAVTVVLAFALLLQPPRPERVEHVQQVLAWARAGLFSAGVLAFVLAALLMLRPALPERAVPPEAETAEAADQPGAEPLTPRRLHFTVVALGRRADDTRAISDAHSAAEAIAIMSRWSDAHPDERIAIFRPDGKLLAFRRAVPALRNHAA